MKVLEPMCATKAQNASRIRGRIEPVLDRATVRGHRDKLLPKRWNGSASHTNRMATCC
ncbi:MULTISPECIES: hypothetical protein [Paraburkholderia]|nr:hypothetical protein [Paraburkholderia podalyriae]